MPVEVVDTHCRTLVGMDADLGDCRRPRADAQPVVTPARQRACANHVAGDDAVCAVERIDLEDPTAIQTLLKQARSQLIVSKMIVPAKKSGRSIA